MEEIFNRITALNKMEKDDQNRPVLSKHNVEVVNRNYFNVFEKTLTTSHRCSRFTDEQTLQNTLKEISRALPVILVPQESYDALVQYVFDFRESFWNNIEGKTKNFDPVIIVDAMTDFSVTRGGRREICLCSALCRYLSEWTPGSILTEDKKQHRFPFYNRPVRKALERYGYTRLNRQNVSYNEFANAMTDLADKTGLNYVELDHILWIYGRML